MFDQHKENIRKYQTGKDELRKIVQDLIKNTGTAESARKIGVTMQYLTNIKNDNVKQISYQKLLDIAIKLSE